MPSFTQRTEEAEIMDDLHCHGEVVDQTLRELEFINKWLGGNEVTVNGLAQLRSRTRTKQKWSIADMGCGGGDMLQRMAAWATKQPLEVELLGVDANPHIIQFARKNCVDLKNASFVAKNVFDPELANVQFDVITATLFTHHFTHEELVRLLKLWKRTAKEGIVINDLHRHWLAYYSIYLLTQLFSKSPMVKFDAPLSVRRGFKKREWVVILQQAGITTYTIRWKWAFRWQLIISTPS